MASDKFIEGINLYVAFQSNRLNEKKNVQSHEKFKNFNENKTPYHPRKIIKNKHIVLIYCNNFN